MAEKYYAVRVGKVRGVYFSWEDCKSQVEGVAGAQYKSFGDILQARDYVLGNTPCEQESAYKPGTAVAYVDGSYRDDTGEFSCGAVLFYEGEQKLFSKKYNDPDMKDMRNVAGEIMGAASVISYCLENKISKLEIYHDYEGIAKWATGEWKANKVGTKEYARRCKEAGALLEMSFIKVKSHSGDTYNDMADELARKALGI